MLFLTSDSATSRLLALYIPGLKAQVFRATLDKNQQN